MKRRRVRLKVPPRASSGQAMEHPQGQTSDPERAGSLSDGQPEREPDVDHRAAPERDVEDLAGETAPAEDQQAVREACADEWLDAEVGTEPPVERRSDLQRE